MDLKEFEEELIERFSAVFPNDIAHFYEIVEAVLGELEEEEQDGKLEWR